jgi:CHAT domain-containing protein
VSAELNKSRIIIVADGSLHYIPFQILTPAAAGDQPLVATTEVINSPSASILGQLRQEAFRKQVPTKVLAAFGDPVFASNYAQRKDSESNGDVAALQYPEEQRWRQTLRDIDAGEGSLNPDKIQPLYFAKHELASLQNVAGSETFLATGFDATLENLKHTDLTKYAILHFATHGYLNPKHPENSGLYLSTVTHDGRPQNGFVGLGDIYGLRAPVSLVVLSACETGLGKDIRGEGLIGVTRGFMYAGAASVVSSLWKVDDEVTAELMKHFYANMLQRGMPPAAALRAAQNKIREQPQWRAPYYWAAFTFQGEYQQSIRVNSPTVTKLKDKRLIAVAISALLLIGLGGLLIYRHFGRFHYSRALHKKS